MVGRFRPVRGSPRFSLTLTGHTSQPHRNLLPAVPYGVEIGWFKEQSVESGVTITNVSPSTGVVRLRRKMTSLTDWQVEIIGSGLDLTDI